MKTRSGPVPMNNQLAIRPFDGSLADAEGLLTVERATFAECPYDGRDLCAMLTEGSQRAWLAVGREGVLGFVIAFETLGLRERWWEIDLLAVLPAWRGRRLATRLVQAAVKSAGGLKQARAVVATDNTASARAFARVGFRKGSQKQDLLVCRAQELAPRRWSAPDLVIGRAQSMADVSVWLATETVKRECPDLTVDSTMPDLAWGTEAKNWQSGTDLAEQPELTLLLAQRAGRSVGHAELVHVQTLLYRGLWIESLSAVDRSVREALVHETVRRAQALGIDEVGAMVPESNTVLRETLPAAGFRSLGEYFWLKADLPPQSLSVESDPTDTSRCDD